MTSWLLHLTVGQWVVLLLDVILIVSGLIRSIVVRKRLAVSFREFRRCFRNELANAKSLLYFRNEEKIGEFIKKATVAHGVYEGLLEADRTARSFFQNGRALVALGVVFLVYFAIFHNS